MQIVQAVFGFFMSIINFIVSLLGGPSMLKFLVRRILAALPVLFAIMVVTFGLSHSIPGGPFDTVNQRRMPDHIRQQLEERYGLNKSLFFDTPTDGYGPETVNGKQSFVKGGYGQFEEGVYDELDGTGVKLTGTYDLWRWDDDTETYIQYEEHPYREWVEENADLVHTTNTLSGVSTLLAGMPAATVATTGYELTNTTSTDSSLDLMHSYLEDCRIYKQWPGWAVVARRQECSTGGGTVNVTFNQAGDVTRLDPLDTQFWNYFWNVLNLDFGPSLNIAELQENRQVSDEISERLPVSMEIGVVAVVFGFLMGVPLGVLAAVYHNSIIDYIATFFAVLGQSTPNIVLAPLLIIVFAVELGWLPTPQRGVWVDEPFFSRDHLTALVLPTIALGTGMSAGIARLTRASLLQVLNEDYIRTARAKGLRERTVIYLHALKNSLIPVATILGPLLAVLLTGTFVVELIFLIPGLGKSFIDSVGARDYTTIMGVTMLYSVFLIAGNILVDVIYTWLDPRIRFD
ncbi:MAG: ABC transporter permease [Chloroflexi bacterium]|nr:ABC transporter permease [Chloroflexota bacterium]